MHRACEGDIQPIVQISVQHRLYSLLHSWPMVSRFYVVSSSCFEHSRVTDRFVIGLKIKEKYIHIHEREYVTFICVCLAKTGM